MTDQPTTGGTAMDPQLNEIISEVDATRVPQAPAQAPREALDREENLIRDAVLRMGALVEAAIREASRALQAHDAALALDVIKGDAIINEAQRGVSRLISVTIATQQPVARDLRYLLTLDHVT
jgi:phosphate uptake regulator